MIFRPARLGCCLMMFAITGPAIAADSCGPGCHSAPFGPCVRDGWQQGLPVRNECPAVSMHRSPCGEGYRWDRRMKTCFQR